VLEYRGDLVERETIYVTEHIEPPSPARAVAGLLRDGCRQPA
jgi:hypothetical protein